MDEQTLHGWLVWAEVGLGVLTVLALLFVSAPYGRHQREGWGPKISARLGWIVMESPAVVWFALVFTWGARRGELVPLVFAGFWLGHYVYRTYVFPFRLRANGKTMPLLIAALAFVFQLLNGYINARWVSGFGTYDAAWLTDPRFLAGAFLFLFGFGANLHSDEVLLRLRGPGETGYKIPRGGLYRWVSAPNYFGEILEWFGWALMTWSPAGLAFALYTTANLLPRALDNHRWYRDKFPDYPTERRALVPYIL